MRALPALILAACFHPPESPPPARPGLDAAGELAIPAPWYPGEAIPGWEDFECEPPGIPDYVIPQEGFGYRFATMAHQLAGPSQASIGLPSEIYLQLRTCEWGVVCYPEYDADRTEWGLFVHAYAGAEPPPPAPRGQGWYYPDGSCTARSHRTAFASLSDVVINTEWQPGELQSTDCRDTWTIPAQVSVCFSRIRPDQMIGTAWFRVLTWSEGGYADEGEDALFEVPFQVDFPEHGGEYHNVELENPPDEVLHTQYLYLPEQPYDNVWPWADITDPVIREYVRERYRPWYEEEALAAAAAKGE